MKPTTDFPFLLDNPRAWRTYLGGRMLDALHGDSNGEDGHFPEEWILSTVAARNAGREQFPEEGMSHLRGTDVTLRSVLESDTEGYLGKGAAQPTLGVLTKLIDSAERLTLQVHPDKPTALRLFQSQYGKTECWHILSGHPVNGEEPCIYYGFQPDMTRARWEALFHAQDIPGMLAGMQKYPVHPGDTILIEGGMPHTIGAGCFLVEIQEPTEIIRSGWSARRPAALPWPTVCAIRGLALKRCLNASTMSRTAARRSTTAGSSNRKRC